MRTNELMLYKNMEHGRILKNMTFLMENCGNDYYNREDLRSLLFECMNDIRDFCQSWIRGESLAYISDVSSCK